MSASSAVSRSDRDALIALMQRYIDEEISAFEFDDELQCLSARTDDAVVQEVVRTLWYHYDDLKDHLIVATKQQWNFFQRLILLLRTDSKIEECEILERVGLVWTDRQPIAMLCLMVFVGAVLTASGVVLVAITALLGLVSIGLAHFRRKEERLFGSETRLSLLPFSSLAQLRKAYCSSVGFRKRPYPPHVGKRQIRGILDACVPEWVLYPPWLLFSPIVLLIQSLPERHPITRVSAETE